MRKMLVNVIISIAIGGLFIWLAIRDVDWVQVGRGLVRANLWIVAGYFVFFCLVQLVRTVRWGTLLRPLGQVDFKKLLSVASVGFMALIVLPLRLGEFIRPILVADTGKIRMSAALATIVVERIIDSLVMAFLLVVLVFLVPEKMNEAVEVRTWGFMLSGLFLGMLLVLLLIWWKRKSALVWFARFFGFLPKRILDKCVNLLDSFIDGLQALPNARLFADFMGYTFLYWGLAGFGMWWMFLAFPELADLGWVEAFACLSVLCVGLMIPAGPGMIGNFHYFVKLGLSLFVSQQVLGSAGLAYAILVHAVQLVQHLVFGLLFLFSSHTSFEWILRQANPSRTVESACDEAETGNPAV